MGQIIRNVDYCRIEKPVLMVRLVLLLSLLLLGFLPLKAEEKEEKFGFAESFPEVHGALSGGYSDFGRDGPRTGNSEFDMRGAYLRISSKVHPKVRGLLELAWEDNSDDVSVSRVELNYPAHKMLDLTVGKFPIPLGLHSIKSYVTEQKYPRTLRPRIHTDVLLSTWRESGVKIRGDYGLFNYTFWVSNGLRPGPNSNPNQERTQNSDNNNNKMSGGKVGALFWNQLSVGGSYGATRISTANTLARKYRTVYAEWKPWEGRLEILSEWADNAIELSTTTYHKDGLYLQVAYKAIQNKRNIHFLESVVRFETINLDDRIKNNQDQDRWSLGVNWSPHEHLVLKSAYTLTHERYDDELRNDGYGLELVIDF